MTNFSDLKQRQTEARVGTKLPLIPPASIRTSRNVQSNDHESNPATQRNKLRSDTVPSSSSSKTMMGQLKKSQKVNNNNNNRPSSTMGDRNDTPEVWCSIEDLFWDHMREVQNKWDTLKMNDDIWAKLMYFEKNRRLAKAYVSAPVLTIDGSTNGLDGFRIGLSGIDNSCRNLDSISCLRSIGQGIKLKIDIQGNILIRKIGNNGGALSKCSIFIKDWPSGSSSSYSLANNRSTKSNNLDVTNENCTMREIEHSDVSYKLFDMRKFRLQLERRKLSNNSVIDWRQCVSIISFVRKSEEKQTTGILDDPCWLMIINIIAIDMMKSTICDNKQESKPPVFNLDPKHDLSRPAYQQQTYSEDNRTNLDNNSKSINSSLSILAQTDSSIPTSNDTNEDDLGIDEDRVKKPRTGSNDRNSRQISARKDISHYRQYRSSQHLPNSNIIYTTFNSKFMNSNHPDNLSTSDYYSASRSSTKGYNYLRFPLGSSSNMQINRIQADNKHPFMRTDFVQKLEYDRSLSNSDLSQPKFDLKPIKSSIKMNYDSLSETEDTYEADIEIPNNRKSSRNISDIEDELGAACTLENRFVSSSKTDLDVRNINPLCHCAAPGDIQGCNHVNHHKCKAMDNIADEKCQNHGQKLSRSSIASSSSSGCADNDYFMSHSTSSVSSSSASNDRELSSQPASSSGIVCSGNTSDASDDVRKSGSKTNDINPVNKSEIRQTKSKIDMNNEKTVHPPMKTSNQRKQSRLLKTPVHQETKYYGSELYDVNCDCVSVEYNCDCCCDCYIDRTSIGPINCCNYDDHDIYNRSPTPRNTDRTRPNNDSSPESGLARDSVASDFNRKLTNINPRNIRNESSNHLKTPSSWLEKRKYGRILPKFIFPSSNVSRRIGNVDDKNSHRKSNTIDRVDKFKLTQSNQDLS